MHNIQFQNDIGRYTEERVSAKNDPHKAFVERLKKQVLSDESSSDATDSTAFSDNEDYNLKISKELEERFDALFANLDDDND